MLPVKMFELFSLGIPVITFPNKVIAHYLNDSMYFSYDPDDLDTLINLLERIVTTPELIMEKRNAILREREHFIWSYEQKKYINLLNSLK